MTTRAGTKRTSHRVKRWGLGLTLGMALFTGLLGCRSTTPAKPVDYASPLPPGTLALRKIPPGQYPDFSAAADPAKLPGLLRAIQNSLAYLQTPSSRQFFPYEDISQARAVQSLLTLQQLVQVEQSQPGNDQGRRFDAAIRSKFEVYESIGGQNPDTGDFTGDVLFTAYFTPTYNASLTRTGPYQYPLYKRPADLIETDGEHAFRRAADGQQVPYYTRGQIEMQHALSGDELVWLDDRFAAYIVTVQGSARLRLTDGRILEVGYNGNNGMAYASPGRQMLADGVITQDQLTLSGLKTYFAQHPEAMDRYLQINPREVFFSERPGGPFGSLNQPVTAFATIATDKSVYPRAMPAFVKVQSEAASGSGVLQSLMLDQDTGGAIRAAGRCDIYMGLGDQAGQELNVGKLYYLALKPELVRPTP